MTEAREAEPVTYFAAVLAAREACLDAAREALAAAWGPVAVESGALEFSYTDYYAAQTGQAIRRAFFGFAAPAGPDELAARKLRANAMEKELAAALASDVPRPVNVDPGYLAPDKVILASCKNFAHRIYLGQGVYAELTLQYIKGRFTPLRWTFPDYASGDYFPFFRRLRQLHMDARRAPSERS